MSGRDELDEALHRLTAAAKVCQDREVGAALRTVALAMTEARGAVGGKQYRDIARALIAAQEPPSPRPWN